MENEFNPAKMLVERALSMIDEMPEQAAMILVAFICLAVCLLTAKESIRM